MQIKVLGTGCPTCKKLYKDVTEIVEELGLEVEVNKIEDIQQIMEYGIMSVPALIINENVKFSGKSPNKEELKKYFIEDSEPTHKCSCGCDS